MTLFSFFLLFAVALAVRKNGAGRPRRDQGFARSSTQTDTAAPLWAGGLPALAVTDPAVEQEHVPAPHAELIAEIGRLRHVLEGREEAVPPVPGEAGFLEVQLTQLHDLEVQTCFELGDA